MPLPPPTDRQIAEAKRREAINEFEGFGDALEARFERYKSRRIMPPPPSNTPFSASYYVAPTPVSDAVSDEFSRLIDMPLNDGQRDLAAGFASSDLRIYDPKTRYEEEADREERRLYDWLHYSNSRNVSSRTRDYFYYPMQRNHRIAAVERLNIIARRNIRRRWQKLGVWNSEWGIPGREANPQPNDDLSTWKWPWQDGAATIEDDGLSQHPVERALRQRQRHGLRRTEHQPIPAHSHLNRNASASQGESFIMSRPWLMFELEACEEAARYVSLPSHLQDAHHGSIPGNVKKRWRERGEWNDEWKAYGHNRALVGWKWRHESPSPEPEDLTGIDDLPAFELTPSEIDALEAVPQPPPPSPQRKYDRYIIPVSPFVGRTASKEDAAEELRPRPQQPLQEQPAPQPQSPPRRRRPSQRPSQRPRASTAQPPRRRSARVAAQVAVQVAAQVAVTAAAAGTVLDGAAGSQAPAPRARGGVSKPPSQARRRPKKKVTWQ